MSKTFWSDLAAKGPIAALAPMDGYCDSPYRRLNKEVAPRAVVFSEFYSADGLVKSPHLAPRVLPHHASEKPLIIQIFGKDPDMFAQAAKIIEGYGATGVDINMGCPARGVVKSGHGSCLMIHKDTAFRIVEAMAKAVSIPVSVKTRLGWQGSNQLSEFCLGLQNAGANLITVHGRTYAQAYTGAADWTQIYETKKLLSIPMLGNGDVADWDDGMAKKKNLDGFMIGRGSFGNPWCFLPGGYKPTLEEILKTMGRHAQLLVEYKGEDRACLEIRKHLVQYLHAFEGVKEFRKRLVSVESLAQLTGILDDVRSAFGDRLHLRPGAGEMSDQKLASHWDKKPKDAGGEVDLKEVA